MSQPIYNDTTTCECGEELDPLERCDCENCEKDAVASAVDAIVRRLLCAFGRHDFCRTTWAKVGDYKLTRRDCVQCGYCPTFER